VRERSAIDRTGAVSLGLLMAACLSLSPRASAQEAAAAGARTNIFISPSGEPFHAAPGAPYPIDAWFNRADTNHDGALSLEEFQADAVAFFHKLDANGDGVIDGFEIEAYEQKIAPEILPRIAQLTARDIPPLPAESRDDISRLQAAPQEHEPRHKGPAVNGAAVFGLIREPEPVAAADTDFDGKVSLAEMISAARRRFEELDLNHDGRLLRAELPKTPAERLAEKAERKHRDGPR
jgi:hypothetical protein